MGTTFFHEDHFLVINVCVLCTSKKYCISVLLLFIMQTRALILHSVQTVRNFMLRIKTMNN